MKKILDDLKSAIANLSEFAQEKAGLVERRQKAKAEITAAADEKLTPQIEAKIARASNVMAVCDARLARLETGLAGEAEAVWSTYTAARSQWNKAVAVRRELARAAFHTANLPFFNNDEHLTAQVLAGVLPPSLYAIGRAGWDGCYISNELRTPEFTLREIETFLGHVERQAELNGIPIE
jgi:hypothetical protein